MGTIFHITTKTDWDRASTNGEYSVPTLQSEGFIHCSKINQIIDTANLYYKGKKDLLLLVINEVKLKSIVKYEAPTLDHSPEISLTFPHIYGPINLDAVVEAVDFIPAADELFKLPDRILKYLY